MLTFAFCNSIQNNRKTLYRRIDKIDELRIENFPAWNHRYLHHFIRAKKFSLKNSPDNIQKTLVGFLEIINFAGGRCLVLGIRNRDFAGKFRDFSLCLAFKSALEQRFSG